MIKATKIRIYPSDEQKQHLLGQFGAVRMVYNKSLHAISSKYKKHGLKLRAKKDIKPLLVVAKKSRKYGWLKQYDSITLQQAVINLDKAYQNFFNPKLQSRYPQFKRRHHKQTSYHCTCISVGNDWIKIPKCHKIKAKVHRIIEGKVKSITLSKTSTGKYFASILSDDGAVVPCKDKSIDKVTAIDLGITSFITDEAGIKIDNPKFIKQAENNLRRKQRKLSKAQKGSKNRAKARLIVAKCHEKLANARNDFQHKLSTQIIDENQAVIVETLKVKNMLKNRKLSKAISDCSWSSFLTKLDYKANQRGKHLIKVDQWFASSKTCSSCGQKKEDLTLSTRIWNCSKCGIHHDRDTNAAMNIKKQGILMLKASGLGVSACGDLHKTTQVVAAV